MQQASLKPAMGRGFWVFVILVVLAVMEYLLAVVRESGNLPWMIVMNLVDAALILYFFMHVAQLWRQEE